jgi:hypothetical protein
VVRSRPVLRTTFVALASGAALSAGASVARANPAGAVASALYPGVDEQVLLGVDYAYELERADLSREVVGDPAADPLAPIPLHKELTFRQARHVVTPHVEIGLYRGVWLTAAVPIIVGQTRELSLAAGLDRAATTTFADGLLTGAGFDASAPGTPPAGALVFRGVTRTGVGEIRGGLGVAPLDQARDPSKPTWKLGVEGRFAVGKVMRFDALDPGHEAGVSTGVHELRVWTSFDRRFRYFEGWLDAFWQRPIYTRTASLFTDPGFGATHTEPGQTAGASFGLETVIVDGATRLSLDLGARLTAHFDGRGYTELWEVFAYAGDRRTMGPLVLDADPVTPGVQALSHPGITNYEGYLETAGKVALRAQLGRHAQLAATGELTWKTDHLISFADAGVDLPTCPTGAPRCETDDNDVVNAGTAEVNPLHARKIDLVGHRYRASASRGVVIGLTASVSF